jgi:uncharacterized small protein (DUF1192 family)
METVATYAAAAQCQGWTLVLSCEPMSEGALAAELSDRFDFVLSVSPDVVIVDPERDPIAAVDAVGAVDAATVTWVAPGAALSRRRDASDSVDGPIGDLDALWNSPTPAVVQVCAGSAATRATALSLHREAAAAEFPSRFERLRSPASAGVDLGPRPSEASYDVRSVADFSLQELRAAVRELDAADDTHRFRVRELLDQSELAVYEQVRMERRMGELVEQIQRLETELAAMNNSKLFRTVAPLRRVYAKLRGHGG